MSVQQFIIENEKLWYKSINNFGEKQNIFRASTSQLPYPYLWATSLRHVYRIFFSKHLSFRFSRNLTSEAILRESFEHREGSFISWHIITRFKTLNKLRNNKRKMFQKEKQLLKIYPNVLTVLLQQKIWGRDSIWCLLPSQK